MHEATAQARNASALILRSSQFGCVSKDAPERTGTILRDAAPRLLRMRAETNAALGERERKTAASIAEERLQDLVEFGDRERT
jgi:hypothetical protein